MPGLTIKGKVEFRSSRTDPPSAVGEKEIQSLNPQREQNILAVTGWPRLEAGSLNLRVGQGVLEALAQLPRTWTEPGATIKYPTPYTHIPELRRAYWYFLASAQRGECSHAVLVRRAENALPGIVELFAPVNLTEFFGVDEGDEIEVDVRAV